MELASKKAAENCLTPNRCQLERTGKCKYLFREVLDYEPDNIYGNPDNVRVL